MQYAIDKVAINKTVYAGTGTLPNSVLPQLRYDATLQQLPPYPYNLAKAKQLMAQSGYAKGFSTTCSTRRALPTTVAWPSSCSPRGSRSA